LEVADGAIDEEPTGGSAEVGLRRAASHRDEPKRVMRATP